MKTLKMAIELQFDEGMMHGDYPESIEWFYKVKMDKQNCACQSGWMCPDCVDLLETSLAAEKEKAEKLKAAADGAVPALDLLEERLEDGATIAKQDGRWHLFAADGDGICSGRSVREMLVNLIFTAC